jgi:hypothetical protein
MFKPMHFVSCCRCCRVSRRHVRAKHHGYDPDDRPARTKTCWTKQVCVTSPAWSVRLWSINLGTDPDVGHERDPTRRVRESFVPD